MSKFADALQQPAEPSRRPVAATRQGRKHVGAYVTPDVARQLLLTPAPGYQVAHGDRKHGRASPPYRAIQRCTVRSLTPTAAATLRTVAKRCATSSRNAVARSASWSQVHTPRRGRFAAALGGKQVGGAAHRTGGTSTAFAPQALPLAALIVAHSSPPTMPRKPWACPSGGRQRLQ